MPLSGSTPRFSVLTKMHREHRRNAIPQESQTSPLSILFPFCCYFLCRKLLSPCVGMGLWALVAGSG